MTNKPSSHAKRPGHTLVAVAVLLICALVILPSGCLDNNKDSGADTKAPTAPPNNDKKVPGPGSTDPGSRPVTTPQDPAKPVVTEPSTVIARPGGSGGGSSGSSSVIELTSIAITQSSPQTVYNGGTLQLSSTLTPSDATYTGRTWYSNDTSIATVDTSGRVTGVADGTARIYVNSSTYPLINTSIEVTVVSIVDVVDSVASLNEAISASNVTNITLSKSIDGNVDATRTSATNLTIDFGNYSLAGSMQINADSLLGLNLTGTANPAVTGKLTVSAESATVRNRLNVSGKIDIKAVANHSWVEQAEGNSLSMEDPNGASLILEKSPREVKVTSNAKNINITTTVPVEIIIDAGAIVSNITASDEAASGTNITNNGIVANISTATNTNITVVNNNNNSNITVDGSGTIGFSGAAAAVRTVQAGVTVVTDISSDLDLNKTPIYADDTFNITGVSLNDTESFYVKSAGATIVNVSNSSELNLTAMATGRTSVTVQVKNSTTNDILKQGTIFVTVVPQEISSALVTMTAPVVGASPASVIASDLNYTVTETSWSPELTQGGKFNADTVYIARVTLTSKNGKAFQQAQFTPTATNSSSVTNTTTTGSSSGNRVSFDVTFPQTDALSVTNIDITTQPSKLVYKTVVDNVLSLNGMVVKATYNNGETETATFAGTQVAGYSTNLTHGQTLNASHNGIPVNVTHIASGKHKLTTALTVKIAGNTANLSTFKVNGTDVLALSNVTNLTDAGHTLSVNDTTGFNNITATAYDSNATVTIEVNGVNVTSSANTTVLHHDNVITVTVVSEDRNATEYYKVTVKESGYRIDKFNLLESQRDYILFEIARNNSVSSENIPNLGISNFTLNKMVQSGAQTINGLGLGERDGNYTINLSSGDKFVPGNYTLKFEKEKHDTRVINFIIEGVTDASVNLTQGSVNFGYTFKNATDQSISYAVANGAGYWLDENNSTVQLIYYANHSTPVNLSSLNLDSNGSVKYESLAEIQAAFKDPAFFTNLTGAPTGIMLNITGRTGASSDAAVWYLNRTITFTGPEMLIFSNVPQNVQIGTGHVNITAPVRGATPQTHSDVESATSSANYTVSSLTWYNASGVFVGGTFEAGEVYTANMSLTSNGLKAFSPTFNPTVVNGSVSTVLVNGMGAGNDAWVNVTFDSTVISSNANLSALNVAPDTLAQPFANTTHEYNVTVGKENTSISVTATLEDANAALTINGTGVASGSPSSVTLKDVGELTIVPVVVTAEDGTTIKTYTITVSRVVPSMAGTVTIEGDAVYGKTLTANTAGITYNLTCTQNVPTYQWYNGSIIANATNDTFVIRVEDIGTNISVTVTADDTNAIGSVTSENSSTVIRATPAAAPDTPELWNKTNNTVNLTAITGAEYSYNGTWQNTTLFTGLTPNTEYRFIARYKENATHFNSTNSSVLTVTTNNTTVNILTIEGVAAPVVGEIPVTSIIGTAQYTGIVSWTPNHTKFQGNTTYNASIVLAPKTNFTLDGLAPNFFNVTNATSNTTYTGNSTVVSGFAATGVAEGAAITGLDVPNYVLQLGKTITRTAATEEGGASNWSSSNETVATIDFNGGWVTAQAAGEVLISYNYSTSGNSSSKLITVYAQAVNNSTSLVITDVIIGGVNVTVTGNATLAEGQTIKWVSSNESAATIGETNGTIYALALGNTTISYNITETDTGWIVEEGSREITVLDVAPVGVLSKGVEGNTTNVTKLSAGDYEYWVNDSAKFSATADDYGNISNITVEVGSIINIRATNPLSANQTLTVEMAHIMNGTAPVDLGLAKPGTGTGTNVTGLVAGTTYQYNVTANAESEPAADAIWTELTPSDDNPFNLDNTVVKNNNDKIFIRFKETAKLPASLHTMLIADEHNWKSE